MTNVTNNTRPTGEFEARANARLRSFGDGKVDDFMQVELRHQELIRNHRGRKRALRHHARGYRKLKADEARLINQVQLSLKDEAVALGNKAVQIVKKQAQAVAAGAKAICQKKGAKALQSKIAEIFAKKMKTQAFKALKPDPYKAYKKKALTQKERAELLFALQEETSEELLKVIKGKKYLNQKLDKTAMIHMAAEQGLEKALEHLVDAGASMFLCNTEGHNPLVIAAHHKRVNVVKTLLRLGATKRATLGWQRKLRQLEQQGILSQRMVQLIINDPDSMLSTKLIDVNYDSYKGKLLYKASIS